MREKIIEAIFGAWCDGQFGVDKEADRIIEEIIQDMNLHFAADDHNVIYIERQVMSAVSIQERSAFMAGIEAGLALVTGKFWANK